MAERPAPTEHYARIALRARIEGAGPHELIAILYEELLAAMDAMTAFGRRGDRAGHARSRARALTALHGLDSGLDPAAGGALAANLASIYGRARRVIGDHAVGPECAGISGMRSTLAEIATAWRGIGAR